MIYMEKDIKFLQKTHSLEDGVDALIQGQSELRNWCQECLDDELWSLT